MNFQTTKHKIKTIFDTNQENSNSLFEKESKFQRLQKDVKLFKTPLTLYDSGWITCDLLTTSTDPNPEDEYFYSLTDYVSIANGLSEPNIEHPVVCYLHKHPTLIIPKESLPFVKVSLLTKSYPNTKFIGLFNSTTMPRWKKEEYVRVLGDGGTVIYQGYSPPQPNSYAQYSEAEITAGASTMSLTSRWYTTPSYDSCIEYTLGGFNWKAVGTVISIESRYNVVPIDTGAGIVYAFERFSCPAFSSMSSSSFTGKGYYEKHEWNYVDPDWIETVTFTKNATVTAPIGEDSTSVLYTGQLYRNGVLVGSGTLAFTTNGILLPTGTILTAFNVEYRQMKRIWYDTLWAAALSVDLTNYTFSNLPTKSLYQSGTLPYGYLELIVNPSDGDHPVSENRRVTETPTQDTLFARITPSDADEDVYKLHFTSNIIYTTPSIVEMTESFDYVDETYGQVGSTYVRTAINRPGKTKTTYGPTNYPIEAKLMVTLEPPTQFFNTYDYQKKES